MEMKIRVTACLKALATGDAIGKQSEMLSHNDVLHWYPQGIRGFQGSPGRIIPRYLGNANREWRIGETTDDTEQTIAVARAILRDRNVLHHSVGRELLQCKKSIHSGVKSMWTFKQIGDPYRVATDGDGCGAAMRVSPVGILYSSGRFDDLVKGAYEASIPTHGGQLAICAAAAVAAAVSAALDGGSATDVLKSSVRAAQMAEILQPSVNAVTMASAIQKMHDELSGWRELKANDIARIYFPDRPQIKVPLAISLAIITQSVEDTILLASNIGGDADSVASIGGAIAGALNPESVNQDWFNVVNTVNNDDLPKTAHALAALRN
ncbi:MAG: ADP-ribosylglycohydrolase family protein [Acidobacteria bacterium]|nr:ADP-ribosylglycohydrolase family protein [Acidobacteriota bacterium]